MDDFTHAPPLRDEDRLVPRYFSLSQRIGRLRYFVYSIGGALCISSLLLLIYLFCLTLPPALAQLVYDISQVLIKSIAVPMVVFVMTIRRLHDINFKGWWALLAIVPFITVILLFVPGNPGNNRFGPPPRSNSVAVKLAAIVMPLVMFMLFFALKDSPTHRNTQEKQDTLQQYN